MLIAEYATNTPDNLTEISKSQLLKMMPYVWKAFMQKYI